MYHYKQISKIKQEGERDEKFVHMDVHVYLFVACTPWGASNK
ncbi:MAG: hypothetical protein UV60_C0002G0040 [Parcubacteria group bacterium GW2011_GWA2_43_11]|nr:MAG: hypothetical protein UV60_C0002G0040 [Parcubacteria group bacterium GW2011_GWA2_43_11]